MRRVDEIRGGIIVKRKTGFWVIFLVLALSLSVFAAGSQDQTSDSGDMKFYTFGGSDIGGMWFAEAATLTTQWNADIPGIMWSADTRGGGTANAFWMATGKVEAALNNTPGIRAAMDGIGFFEDKGKQDFSGVRALAALHKSYLTVVVPEKASMQSLEDLRGKRIAVGQPGNSIQTVLPMICDALGWDYENDFKKEFIADSDAFDALRAGRIDAVVEWIGLGAGTYQEEFEKGNVRLLPMKAANIAALSNMYPFYVGGEIAVGNYKNQPAIPVPFTQDFITVQASVDEEVVYQMCKIMYDRLQDGTLVSTHRAFLEAGFPDYIEKISLVKLHPGAARFYKEIGVEIK